MTRGWLPQTAVSPGLNGSGTATRAAAGPQGNTFPLSPCSPSVYTCSSLFPFVCLYLYKHVFYFFLFIGITYLLFEVPCMYVCYLLFPINNK